MHSLSTYCLYIGRCASYLYLIMYLKMVGEDHICTLAYLSKTYFSYQFKYMSLISVRIRMSSKFSQGRIIELTAAPVLVPAFLFDYSINPGDHYFKNTSNSNYLSIKNNFCKFLNSASNFRN